MTCPQSLVGREHVWQWNALSLLIPSLPRSLIYGLSFLLESGVVGKEISLPK